MRRLETFAIKNFKSIRDQELSLGSLNVLIGANGAGKSNLIEAFRFLRELTNRNLARYSLERGADALLFRGRKVSSAMSLSVQFLEDSMENTYGVVLGPADDGSLIVISETVFSQDRSRTHKFAEAPFMQGGREAWIGDVPSGLGEQLRRSLGSYRLYHFHDSSDSAPSKGLGDLEDNRFLRPDGANLAAFLYFLKERHPNNFRLIEDSVRSVAPFFDRFTLEPSRLNPEKIRLEWKEAGSDTYFNAASLSDGSLRFVCLATLLLQPELPPLVLLDEPELGLHPSAIALLAEMLISTSTRTQLIVATQSVTLVNHLDPEHIWTAERKNGESVFRRLVIEELTGWLDSYEGEEGYGLGELWEKNILGARP